MNIIIQAALIRLGLSMFVYRCVCVCVCVCCLFVCSFVCLLVMEEEEEDSISLSSIFFLLLLLCGRPVDWRRWPISSVHTCAHKECKGLTDGWTQFCVTRKNRLVLQPGRCRWLTSLFHSTSLSADFVQSHFFSSASSVSQSVIIDHRATIADSSFSISLSLSI